jgi:hypothetical protein
MTLSYDSAGGKKVVRKWQCFVCGEQHPSYEEYKTHILDTHEEGREYIKCPTCEAPVRDMGMHFAVKHPNRVCPKGTQMKVTIWYDFTKDGKKKARKPKFRDGYFVSEKNGTELHYRSGYECEVYELLEQDKEVASYEAEPFKVPYYWINPAGQGEWLNYIPDLRVNYSDGRVQIMEIKPANQTGLDKNKAKWAAMNDYAKKFGWEFTVITEVGIGKMKTKVKQQLND